nr:TonB-dependent receptor [uncultured Lichenicoccus sp.]
MSTGRPVNLMLLVASAAVLGWAGPVKALAQAVQKAASSGGSSTADTGDIAVPKEKGGIEQVVVTSAKRAQLINKVPESVSVLSGKTIKQQHIRTFEDVTRQTPGLSFAAGNTVSGGIVGPNTQNLVIRGISSTAGSATVAVYLDDTSITQSNLYVGAELPRFVDMDRVEVLRGPQGTLFGASSMGGTIRLITNQPKFNFYGADLSSDASGTVHGGANWDEQGAVNIPLIKDKMALRIAGDFGSNSGYINRLNPDGSLAKAGVNDEHWNFIRGTLKYQPADDLEITTQVLYQTDRTGDTPVFYPQLGTYNEDKPVTEPSRDYLFIPSVTIRKYFPDFSLTSASSYLQRTFSFQSDGTVFNSQVIATAFLDPAFPAQAPQADAQIGTLPSQVHRDDRTYQASEELRAASTDAELFGRQLNWIGGLYFQWQRQVRDDTEPAPGISAAFQNIYGFSVTDSPFGGAALGGLPYANYQNDVVYSDNQSLIEKQYAGFAQADYSILKHLRFTAGIRYSYATQSYFRSSGGVLAFGNAFPFTSTDSTYAATPKFSLAYDLDPESILYATIAKGFRLGGPTGPVSGTTCKTDLANVGIGTPPTSYGPDRLWSYETGLKKLMLHDKLSIDFGLYYIDWQNIQQSINLPTCGASITQNFGGAKSYGTEIQVRAEVLPGLTLSAVGGITRAIITQSPNDLAAAPGQDVLNVPKWTGTFAADYEFKLGRKAGGFARGDFDVIGSSHGAFNDLDPAFHQPRYGLLNGSVGMNAGRWVFTLYGKNLTNNKQIIQRPSINFTEEGYLLRPLTAGVSVSTRF